MEIYSIQEWLFKTAHGKFDFDLAESGIQFQTINDIDIKNEWILDYSIDRGQLELRELIADNYLNTNSKNVVITHGGQEALYLLYQSILNSDDHVITISPGWQQSWEVPKSIGANVTLLNWEPGQNFPIKNLEKEINNKTKLLILNSPCNPIGSRITTDEWNSIIKIAKKHNIYIVNDEEYLIDFKESIISFYDKSFSVSSLSKVFGMPALRLGWLVGPELIIEKVINYKRYTSVCNSLLCENIAINVLKEKKKHIDRYNKIIDEAYPILKNFISRNEKYVSLVEPQNTPFAWLNLKIDVSSAEFCEKLLNDEKMLVMPAEVFGHKKGIRVTYGREKHILDIGFDKLERVFSSLESKNK